MPFFTVTRQVPVWLSRSSQTPNIVNRTEISILKEQLTQLEARNFELYAQLVKERDDKQEANVRATILEMELENERYAKQGLLTQIDDLQNIILDLHADFELAKEETNRLSKNGNDKSEPVASQSTDPFDSVIQLEDVLAKYQSLINKGDQLQAEPNKKKADLAKFVENGKSRHPTATWKRVLKTAKLNYKKRQLRWKCLVCRNSFGNPILLRRHQKLCKITTAGSSTSSRASSAAITVKEEVCHSSPKILVCTTLETSKGTQSTNSSLNEDADISSSSSSEATPSPNASTYFKFLTPEPPQLKACSVILSRISLVQPSNGIASSALDSQDGCSSSLVVELQRTRDTSTTFKKHSRNLTKRHDDGLYCLCGIQFPDRRRFNRHLQYQSIVPKKKELAVWKPRGVKKRSLSELISALEKEIKVEQED